ncbi:unnamed protein product [Gemmata massiliana]|uniref:Uncharacterized protein n=1 Tax=Gemmata massiliana TaxID=1210884 RepID=A0A6P2D1W3_9BACT|nr:hypothetical protein [Gemmata massiliana]VTR95103.1 unnamed protein product [Gemmata massiliana]
MPLPPLVREEDEIYLTGQVVVPWYRTEKPSRMTVMNEEDDEGKRPTAPTPVQIAAFERTVANGAGLREPILQQFHEYVPELEAADWAGLEAFFQLTDVRLLPIEKDGIGYVGLVFSCFQFTHGYEHGVGIILHGDRIVHFGMAEEAETGEKAYIDAGLLKADEEEEEF